MNHSSAVDRFAARPSRFGLTFGAVAIVATSIFAIPSSSSAQAGGAPPAGAPERGEAKVAAGRAVDNPPAFDSTPAPPRPADAPAYNRPTVSKAEYDAAKAAAADSSGTSTATQVPVAGTPEQAAPLSLHSSFVGDEQGGPGGSWVPPDTHGAVGNNQFTEVTNSDIRAWSLATSPPTQILHKSLNAHFGGAQSSYFDPRVLYHPTYNRWIALSTSFPVNNGATQILSVSVSNSPNVAGGYCTYNFDTTVTTGDGDFYDFPMAGFDHDALIITANIFGANGFEGAHVYFWPLAEMTSGCLGFGFNFFAGLRATLAPPKVYDRNPRTFLAANATNGVWKYTARDTGRLPVELTGPVFVDTPDWAFPPEADQFNLDNLDSIDGRFQDASTQVGNFLYNIHTRSDNGGDAALSYYKINTSTNALDATCFFTGGGDDINPSISANSFGDIFFNWTVTRRTAAQAVEAVAAGIEAASAVCPPFLLPYGSGPEYNNNNGVEETHRWGDYSSVYLKNNVRRALVVNEIVAPSGGTGTGTVWTSKVAEVRFS